MGEGPAAAGERLVRVGERARLLKLAVPTDSFAELEAVMTAADWDFVQLNYSILTPDAEQRLLPP